MLIITVDINVLLYSYRILVIESTTLGKEAAPGAWFTKSINDGTLQTLPPQF